MIFYRNALREPSFLDFNNFFVSEKDEEVPVGRGGLCEVGLCVWGGGYGTKHQAFYFY